MEDYGLDISELSREFVRIENYQYGRQQDSDEVRFNHWRGQHPDGRKHDQDDGTEAWPWDGASDTRVRLADSICNELGDILRNAFFRGNLRAEPIESSDMASAGQVTSLMNYLREGSMRDNLRNEVSMLANYVTQYGLGCVQVYWDRQVGRKYQPITMDEIREMVAQVQPGSAEANLVEMIMDEEREKMAAQLISDNIAVSEKKALAVVRDLRKTGQAEVPVEVITKNCPGVVALKAWEDVFFPPETLDLQDAAVVYRREWMTEDQLKAKVHTDGWDESWVDEVLNAPSRDNYNQDNAVSLARFDYNSVYSRLYEVVYAYRRVVDDEGVPCVHMVVFNPRIGTDNDRPHGLTEKQTWLNGHYPFVSFRREHLSRRLVDSRGVPEIVRTWENEIKAQRDMLTDRSSLTVLPPFTYSARIQEQMRLEPGAGIPTMRADEIRFLDPPRSNPGEAINVIAMVREHCDEYFGRMGGKVNEVTASIRRQALIDNWVMGWSEVFNVVFMACQSFYTDAELERITGLRSMLPGNVQDMAGAYDISISFDAREMDQNYQLEKLQAISQLVLPEDTAGVVDRAALTKLKLSYLDPSLAKQVVTDKTGASQRVFDEVNNAIALAYLGNAPQLKEADPTSGMKLQFMQQIMQSNPTYQNALQADERFRVLMEQFTQHLQFNMQQQQNAQIGRLGVQQEQ
jgi:hypothetical protein